MKRYGEWMDEVEHIILASGVNVSAPLRFWEDAYRAGMSPRIAVEWAETPESKYGRRTSNPGRPPKAWMKRCIKGASKTSDDPGAVCGSLWHHKMSPAKKRAALRSENPYTRLANPFGW